MSNLTVVQFFCPDGKTARRGHLPLAPHPDEVPLRFGGHSRAATWRKRIEADAALEPGQIAEVESHLRDKVDDLTARGRTPEQAFDEAVRALGEAGVIGAQFF